MAEQLTNLIVTKRYFCCGSNCFMFFFEFLCAVCTLCIFSCMYTPYTPLSYSKTGVCRCLPICLIFAPKHRLWVVVRTTSAMTIFKVSLDSFELSELI